MAAAGCCMEAALDRALRGLPGGGEAGPASLSAACGDTAVCGASGGRSCPATGAQNGSISTAAPALMCPSSLYDLNIPPAQKTRHQEECWALVLFMHMWASDRGQKDPA